MTENHESSGESSHDGEPKLGHLHDHLSFCWSRADGRGGDELADQFVSGLTQRGAIGVSVERRPRSWTIHLDVDKRRFAVLLGLVDEERDEWLLVTLSRLSRLRRLFGGDDMPHLIGLLRWIEEIVFADPDCTDITWRTKAAWHEANAG